ncbi:MAG: alkaline phosphatase family protein [Vicinamibacterales bacterium]
MTSPPAPNDVDALREKLRSLGYLDAGVDRFVLGAVRERHGDIGNALRASVRIGVLAGGLLGPAAAVGVGLRLRELVTGPRDGLVMAGYLFVLFGLAVTLLSFTAAMVADALANRLPARFARALRGARLARAMGALVSAGCLAYLTLWWRGLAQQSNAGIAWTASALVIAVAISFVLGRAVSSTTTALLARTVSFAPSERPSHSTAFTAGLALASFVGAAALLVLSSARTTTDAVAPPPLAVVPTGARLLVAGIDGFDIALADRLAQSERLPALRPSLGGRRVVLERGASRDPAQVWTTIATGLPASAHGVEGLETRAVAGLDGRVDTSGTLATTLAAATDLLRLTRPRLSTGRERQALTFWEVAARAGLKTAAVNWWTTWPAHDADGWVITDRALLGLGKGTVGTSEIGPEALADEVRRAWPRMAADVTSVTAETSSHVPAPLREAFSRSAEIDLSVIALARYVAKSDPDLLTMYLPGLDILQVSTLSAGPSGGAAELVDRIDALERYYEMLDRELASVTGNARLGLVLVGHPGRLPGTGSAVIATAIPSSSRSVSGNEEPDPSRVALEALAPTVLEALGVPLSQELPERPLKGLLEGPNPRSGSRFVSTYGRRATTRTADAVDHPLDEEMRERLRSLGYVR